MPDTLTRYRVFIASPGGLIEERKLFRDLFREFNESSALHEGAYFEPVGWEDTLGGAGRPQSQINEDLVKCEYFVMLLHNRWGSSPSREEEAEYTSGTEEEYHVAWNCYRDESHPMRELILLFKQVAPEQLADPGEQLQKVLEFKKKLEQEKTLLYNTYDDLARYRDLLRRQLDQWLRDHRKGDQGKASPPAPPAPMDSPDPDLEDSSVETPGDPKKLVVEAEKLANKGRLVEAEIKFATAAVGGQDLDAINSYGHFLMRVGRLSQAEGMFRRIEELANLYDDQVVRAGAYGNQGLIYQTRGDLDRAERMFLKSQAINEQLGERKGLANDYGNLGLIYQTRGELELAEEMFLKSQAINDELGSRSGLAGAYGNLGIVYQERGEMGQAEKMLLKSRTIYEELEDREGIANANNNLGLIYKARGELIMAEESLRKSLAINEELGSREGMASQYGNLGIIYHLRDELVLAEEMLHKSLAINEELGRREGMASDYGNLGLIRIQQERFPEAIELWTRSRDIYAEVGAAPQVEKLQSWLDDLPEDVQQ